MKCNERQIKKWHKQKNERKDEGSKSRQCCKGFKFAGETAKRGACKWMLVKHVCIDESNTHMHLYVCCMCRTNSGKASRNAKASKWMWIFVMKRKIAAGCQTRRPAGYWRHKTYVHIYSTVLSVLLLFVKINILTNKAAFCSMNSCPITVATLYT